MAAHSTGAAARLSQAGDTSTLAALRTTLASCALLTLGTGHARAEPDPNRLALVIGNGAYTALPPLPTCVASARAVTTALQRRGFTVLERDDTSNGELRAALGTFERRLIAADNPTSVVYVCGYGTGFDGRPFLLPVSASLQRDTDILAEGLIANFVTDLSARAAPRLTVTLLDVFPRPGAPPPLADLLARSAKAAAVTLAALEPSSASAPTPFAEALVAELASPDARARDLVAAARRALQAQGGSLLVTAATPADDALAPTLPPQAALPAPPPRVSPPSPAAAAPAAQTQAQAAPPQAAPLPQGAPPMDEDRLGDPERRQVQAQLKRLGYYPGQIDGVFGPDTRAAIRRFQFELGADMSGRLTPTQIARLLARAGTIQAR